MDTSARYLLNNAKSLKYDDYLKAGFSNPTGVIEGACRHLIEDRMDITGARWTMRGAEAVLPLERAVEMVLLTLEKERVF